MKRLSITPRCTVSSALPPTRRREFFEDAFGKRGQDGRHRPSGLAGLYRPCRPRLPRRLQPDAAPEEQKVSMSFSALLFGPFYFFYRKAWKPAFGFLAAELLLAAPTFIEMLQLSGSALAPAMSASALTVFARVCSVLSFVLMLVRGMYGKWLYRKSAADHIRRIQSEFPDAQQRSGRAPRPGRRQPWGRAAVYAAADGGGQRLLPCCWPPICRLCSRFLPAEAPSAETINQRSLNHEKRSPRRSSGSRSWHPRAARHQAMPKGMLPLVDKPAIQYLVEEAVRSGITDILIIVSRNQDIIQDHFDRSPELEAKLALPARRGCWKSASASPIWPTSSSSASSRPSASATLSAWPSPSPATTPSWSSTVTTHLG